MGAQGEGPYRPVVRIQHHRKEEEDIMAFINETLVRLAMAWDDLRARLSEERGQDLLEYALLGGLIAAAIVALGVIFSPFLVDMAGNIGACIDFDSSTNCNPGF